MPHSLIATVAALVLAAVIGRLILRHTQSRYQMAAFWLVAILVECVGRPFFGGAGSWTSVAIEGLATTVAILLVKWSTEGFNID
jgi:hypothetical protein